MRRHTISISIIIFALTLRLKINNNINLKIEIKIIFIFNVISYIAFKMLFNAPRPYNKLFYFYYFK